MKTVIVKIDRSTAAFRIQSFKNYKAICEDKVRRGNHFKINFRKF